MYTTLAFRWLLEVFRPASSFATADSDEARNPQRFIHVTVVGYAKKTHAHEIYLRKSSGNDYLTDYRTWE